MYNYLSTYKYVYKEHYMNEMNESMNSYTNR